MALFWVNVHWTFTACSLSYIALQVANGSYIKELKSGMPYFPDMLISKSIFVLSVVVWVVTPCKLVGGYQHMEMDTILQNVGKHLQDYMASQPRRPQSTFLPQLEPYISSCFILLLSIVNWFGWMTVCNDWILKSGLPSPLKRVNFLLLPDLKSEFRFTCFLHLHNNRDILPLPPSCVS
jgi:hypothetical protein